MISRLALVLAGALAFDVAQAQEPPAPTPRRPSQQFAIRADPALAHLLNPLLARIAEQTTTPLSEGETPEAALKRFCGRQAPMGQTAFPEAGSAVVEHAPCLRAEEDVTTRVLRGDVLSAIAARSGLSPQSWVNLRVRKGGAGDWIRTDELAVGDLVLTPLKPEWTSFVALTPRVEGLASIQADVASVLPCATAETASACLARLNVQILDETPRLASQLRQVPAGELPAKAASDVGLQPQVAPGQWPYDEQRVLKILSDAAGRGGVSRTPIVVLDVGLRDQSGAPLQPDVFSKGFPEDPPLRRFGNGTPFSRGTPATVGLCADAYASEAGPSQAVSHGALTASLATGHGLRELGQGAGLVLPELVFGRIYSHPCPAGARLDANPTDIARAFDHLIDRANIFNLSFLDVDGWSGLGGTLAPNFETREKLLIVPAGNGPVGDLDQKLKQFCPACLAMPDRDAALRRRVLVVGAADSQLRRASYSGYGKTTVRFYAPGDGAGGVDLAGRDASKFDHGTSYAAPRVTLAAALARSLAHPTIGMDRIAQRLTLATWPLLDEAGARQPGAGVLDLTKVVAINTYAVERIRPMSTARETFVGPIVGGLQALGICGTETFTSVEVQALALGSVVDGSRPVTVYRQQLLYGELETAQLWCKPSGDLVIQDVISGQVTIPLKEVTLILAPLRP